MFEIYLITNQINEKIYVGQATRGKEARLRRHINDAKHESNLHLHRAMRKYGFKRFTVCLLATAKNKEDMDRLEVFWIKQLRSKNPEIGYNMTEGGEGCTGAIQGPESRAKKSAALMGVHTGKFVGEKSYRFRKDLDTKKIVDLYQNDKSSGEVARELGVSPETIISRLKAAGVKLRSNSEAQKLKCSNPKNTPSYRDDVSDDDIVALFKQNLTYQSIGDKLGASKRCVLLRLRKLGLSRPPRRCVVDKDEVVKRYLSCGSINIVSKEFGIGHGTVTKILDEKSVSRLFACGRKRKTPPFVESGANVRGKTVSKTDCAPGPC